LSFANLIDLKILKKLRIKAPAKYQERNKLETNNIMKIKMNFLV